MDQAIDLAGRLPPDDPRLVHAIEGVLLHLRQPSTAPARGSLEAQVAKLVQQVEHHPARIGISGPGRRRWATPVHLRRLWHRLPVYRPYKISFAPDWFEPPICCVKAIGGWSIATSLVHRSRLLQSPVPPSAWHATRTTGPPIVKG